MLRAKNPVATEGEVRIEKVEKIKPVGEVVTRPPPEQITMVVNMKKVPIVLSAEYIDDYIARKKQQFVQP